MPVVRAGAQGNVAKTEGGSQKGPGRIEFPKFKTFI